MIDINRIGTQLLGFDREQMLGRPVTDFFLPEDREFFLIFLSDILKIGRNEAILAVVDSRSQKHHLDWRAYLVKQDGRPRHIKCIARDVSDIVSRQKQHNIDKKFQGVLEMAGGVAHSLNQPLTIVNNLLRELLAERQDDGSLFSKLVKVQDQIAKMNDIAKNISNIREYAVMDYVAGVRIVDIEKAAWANKIEGRS